MEHLEKLRVPVLPVLDEQGGVGNHTARKIGVFAGMRGYRRTAAPQRTMC